ERKRLLRCLVSEVIVQRDEAAKNAGGQTTVRIGWRSGAWSEVQVRRPSSTDALRTPERVLERIRTLAQQESDARIAQILTAEGLRTRWGLPWTALRVQRVRAYQHIPSACPVLPQGPHPRGDGLLPVATASAHWVYDPAHPAEAIRLDTPAWLAWLDAATTTRFAYPVFDPAHGYIAGFMTVRKEQRQRGGTYWVAYRRCRGQLRKVYLG